MKLFYRKTKEVYSIYNQGQCSCFQIITNGDARNNVYMETAAGSCSVDCECRPNINVFLLNTVICLHRTTQKIN